MPGGTAQALDLGAALGAGGQVLLEPGALVVVDSIDGVGADQAVDVVVHRSSPKVSRRRIRPSRMRVLAVPTGMSSITATSLCV